MRIIGCFVIVAATTLYGIRGAARVREQYDQLRYLRQILYMLQSEIRYTRSYLGEAFRQAAQRITDPYRSWLMWLADEMDKKMGHTFSQIWDESIKIHLLGSGLLEEECMRLTGLGCQLGTADIEMQTKALDLYLEQLSYSMEQVREGMAAKVRLCHCLGVMSGIFIAVLLL